MQEDRAALLASKAYVVVTRHDPYEHLRVEEEFCRHLLERVVMMREVPLMKSALSMERTFQKAEPNKAAFAAKSWNRRGMSVDLAQMSMTQPYDGSAALAEHTRNKATFKVRRETVRKHKLEKISAEQRSELKMLPSEEIKEICKIYHLSRGQVYNIRSVFCSMCDLSGHQGLEELGITVAYFARNCPFLRGTTEFVALRIL